MDPRTQALNAEAFVEIVERLNRFEGPPAQFLFSLVAVQCKAAGASQGAIIRINPDGEVRILSIYPEPRAGSKAAGWLKESVAAVTAVVATGETQVKPLHSPDQLYGQGARRHLLLIPIRGRRGIRGAGAFVIESAGDEALKAARERLEISMNLLNLYEMRLALQNRQQDLHRLKMAMETLSAIKEQQRFMGAAMTFCNELSSRWGCERASFGFLKNRYVQLKAMSHTEKFSRKMKLIQSIEAAMEECLDQDLEILCPAGNELAFVNRAAMELSRRHGPSAVACLPIRWEGRPVAVVALERAPDRPFTTEDIEAIRLTCDLCSARLVNLYESDRWFGARAARGLRKGLSAALGPKHTWGKLLAILILAAIVFLIFAKGEYRIEAPFVLETIEQRVVPAPFDGYLKQAHVSAGDPAQAGKTVMAELETTELRLGLAEAKAERAQYAKQSSAATGAGKMAEAQIATAQLEKVEAQISLYQHYINKAKILAPIDGYVVAGDLRGRIGAPLKKGDALFEVAPLKALRAELFVAEDQISEIQLNQEGKLATAAYPARRLRFTIERINPIAEIRDKHNVFKVRVILLEKQEWMRPGMEGLGKVSVGRRRFAWIWTRRLINWVRMKLWI